jgi:glycosyltransferase involved in cell wall biosynthesis
MSVEMANLLACNNQKKSTMPIKLSAVIITFNEERNIGRCLTSLASIADEIVVVDSCSTDDTVEICRRFANVRVTEQPFLGHVEQKNFALDQATNDYVLSLDADEALSEQLQKEILKVKQTSSLDGHYFNRRTNYCGQWVNHCGWYPDRKLRLFDRRKGRWGGDNPHDLVKMDDEFSGGHLAGDLLHYSYYTISDHIGQTDKFTTIAAASAYKKGVESSMFKVVTRPCLKFIRDYLLKRGFLDGRRGFIICYINALSAFLKYAKLLELQKDSTR